MRTYPTLVLSVCRLTFTSAKHIRVRTRGKSANDQQKQREVAIQRKMQETQRRVSNKRRQKPRRRADTFVDQVGETHRTDQLVCEGAR